MVNFSGTQQETVFLTAAYHLTLWLQEGQIDGGWMIQLKRERERNPFPALEKKPKLRLLTDGESLSVGLNDRVHIITTDVSRKKAVYNQALSQLF